MAVDITQQPGFQTRQTGAAFSSGYGLDFETGSTLSINGVDVTAELAALNGNTATGAEVNVLDVSANSAADTTSVVYRAKVALAAVDTAGGVFAWQNPTGAAIIVDRVVLDVTTVATGACTVDVGMTPTSAVTSADNLIDGVDVNAATGLFSNLSAPGTNGTEEQKVAAGKWVTASKATGASAGIVGSATILYHLA
jgi:hypothetical protein